MRGFLHQLATRSLGLAPQIKSRAALPYTAPATDFSTAETAGNETPPAIERPGFEPQPDVRRNAQAMDSPLPAPIVAENPAPDTPVERPSSLPGISQPPRLSARPSPDMTKPETTPIRQAPPPAIVTSPVVAEQKPAPRGITPTPETRVLAENPRPTLAELETLVTRLLIGDKPGHSEKSAKSATPPAVITPRQAGQRPAEITTIRPPPGAQRQRPTTDPDSAPEVHITIGRLEVNPPSRPVPAAQPPRPRGPAPLSLSDYLARRNGGRS